MKKCKGVIPPIVTPFKQDGSINEASLEKLVKFLSGKVHGLFVCGSYGSGPLMNIEERMKVAEIISKNRKNYTQFIVHVGSTNIRDSVRLAKHAETVGAEKIASIVPYYYHHNKDSIKLFFDKLLHSVNIPVYVYNNPKFTGINISVEMLQELAELGISGVKDSSFDIMLLADFMRKIKKEDFDVVLGTEAMFLPASALGTQAFIPGLGNAFPEICVDLFNAAINHEMEKALRIQKKVNKLRDIMYLAKSTIVAVYTMLKIRGICDSFPREPFTTLSKNETNLMRKELKRIGILEELKKI
ncbi:N-acetylneuraminate lyase [subsurface metagenome]|jgi:dihydrodipicolinate synthase/N-acetylneuraminate lyase